MAPKAKAYCETLKAAYLLDVKWKKTAVLTAAHGFRRWDNTDELGSQQSCIHDRSASHGRLLDDP
ncbi:predicted protein [Plenodomus lingam JN3]|uniref:Predicted protein n=1 Tax=Leptosphaeria maculans (strain JN3 / isolate v23.1.3 / race Av1-4-5-6-7-8) TaxID=985895 RepID=E4ZYP9_LEPMJ|nr:predicted protein [Plenodomus lingam JN3]CBX96575.1 predicted protein [Plenodomus lingam JN3]